MGCISGYDLLKVECRQGEKKSRGVCLRYENVGIGVGMWGELGVDVGWVIVPYPPLTKG